jgi:serine/threonine protein kinase/formylglycine-generating enzyme required for sulfatase activity
MSDRHDADPQTRSPVPTDRALNDAVERLLLEYLDALDALDAGTEPGLEEFMQGQRADVQEELRRRVEPLLRVRRALRASPSQDAATAPGPTLEGTTLGDFELLREVGHGGMGIVLLARQKSLKRLVAVKVLNATVAATTRGVSRFQHETTSAGRLSHPNIVQLLEAGTDRGMRFFAMEWMAGGTLHQRNEQRRRERAEAVRRADTPAVRSAIELSLRATLQIAEALAYIHEHGVIHRDVKPQNILFDDKGTAHLADFGLARDDQASSLSRTGDIAGTPHYLSPEQALAKRITIDHRTDIYSLGVVLYESLSLVKPFDGKTLEQVLFAISFREPKWLRKVDPRIPKDVETVCHKAIEKNPNRRFATAREFADDLRRLLNHEAPVACPPSPVSRILRGVRRHRVACSLVGCALIAAAAGAWAQQARGKRNEARAAYGQLFEKPVEPLNERSPTALTEIRDRLQQVKRLETSLDAPERQRILELSTSFDREIAARRKRALAHLERGMGRPAAASPGTPQVTLAASVQSDVDYFLGLAGVLEVAPFLPDDAELQRWAVLKETYPKVDVVAAAGSSGAQVSWRAIDPFDGTRGEKIVLGRLPLHDAPIAPGYSRIVVERDDGAFAEITRLFVDRSAPYEIVVWFRAPDEVDGDMAPISGGRFPLGSPVPSPGQEAVFGKRDFEIADFSIDRTELSNAEYRRYMDDVARHSPPIQVHRPEVWPDPWDPAWDRLPVTDITVVEAALYAEWAGKRLPTAAEWERAARGPKGYLFPWEPGTPIDLTIGNVERFPTPESTTASLRADFQLHAKPVGECEPGAIGPEGLLHTLGNVGEWTESPALYVIDGRPSVLPFQWQAKGFTFHVIYPSAAREGLTTQVQYPQPGSNSTTGFRCAKSKVP